MDKKKLIIIGSIALVAVVILALVIFLNGGSKTKLDPITKEEDLTSLVEKVYEGTENPLKSLSTRTVDLKNDAEVKSVTGLVNGKDIEFAVVSEPMMSSQAYSFVLIKVKKGVSSDEIAKKVSEGVNPAKWMCVQAEKIYATSSGDVVALVMSSEEWGKPVYDSFKKLAGNTNKEYIKTTTE